MKSLYLIILMLFFSLISPFNVALADDWADPVQVTSSAGDDHHANVGYDYLNRQLLISWDRTEGVNTDVYAIVCDVQSGSFGEEMRVTSGDATEELPQVMFSDMDGSGVFFQSDESGKMAIYYAEFDGDGFNEPWMVLYSDIDLHSPHVIVDGVCIPFPWVFCCSGTGVAIGTPYMFSGEAEFISPQGVGPAYSVCGSVISFTGSWVNIANWACEVEVNSVSEIYYSYYIGTDTFGEIITGYIPNDGYNYRRPVGGIFIERETEEGFDIVSTYFNYDTGEWSFPEICVPDQGNERNYREGGVYEVDYNGDWDIAFYRQGFGEPEIIAPHPAEDRNPIIYIDNDGYHVFWESDRNGTWDIYYSYRGIVGVENEGRATLPAETSLSVHPNPGNAEFRIELESSVAGVAKADVYNVSGRLVHRIYDGWLERGTKPLFWNAEDLPSGMYLVQFQMSNTIKTQKLVLIK